MRTPDIRLTREPNWLTGQTPVAGPLGQLLERQSRADSAVKLVFGPALRAELPYERSPQGIESDLRQALVEGVDEIVSGREPGECRAGFVDGAAALETCLRTSGVEYSTQQSGSAFALKTARPPNVCCESCGGYVRFRAQLARLPDLSAVSDDAITHFLVSLNGGMRLVRASRSEGAAHLEVLLPQNRLDPWRLAKALSAIAAAFKLARRECAALLDPGVAQQYVEFHRVHLKSKGEAT